MPHVALERRALRSGSANQVPLPAVGTTQDQYGGANLDRIPECCARAVRLQRLIFSIVLYETSTVDNPQEPPLRRSVWCRQARAWAILAHRRAKHYHVPLPCMQLETHTTFTAAGAIRTASFTTTVSVRSTVERVASTDRRRHSRDRGTVVCRLAQHFRSHCDSLVAFTML
jgi:hypothetical protein